MFDVSLNLMEARYVSPSFRVELNKIIVCLTITNISRL